MKKDDVSIHAITEADMKAAERAQQRAAHPQLLLAIDSGKPENIKAALLQGASPNFYEKGHNCALEACNEELQGRARGALSVLIEQGMDLAQALLHAPNAVAYTQEAHAELYAKWQEKAPPFQTHQQLLAGLGDALSAAREKRGELQLRAQVLAQQSLATWMLSLVQYEHLDLLGPAADWAKKHGLELTHPLWEFAAERALGSQACAALHQHVPVLPSQAWTVSSHNWEKDGPPEWLLAQMEAFLIHGRKVGQLTICAPVSHSFLHQVASSIDANSHEVSRAKGFVQAAMARPAMAAYLKRCCATPEFVRDTLAQGEGLLLQLRRQQVDPGILRGLDGRGVERMASSGSMKLLKAFLQDNPPHSAPEISLQWEGEALPIPGPGDLVGAVVLHWPTRSLPRALMMVRQSGYTVDPTALVKQFNRPIPIAQALQQKGALRDYERMVAQEQQAALEQVAKVENAPRRRM